jgi:hypothetical protein
VFSAFIFILFPRSSFLVETVLLFFYVSDNFSLLLVGKGLGLGLGLGLEFGLGLGNAPRY